MVHAPYQLGNAFPSFWRPRWGDVHRASVLGKLDSQRTAEAAVLVFQIHAARAHGAMDEDGDPWLDTVISEVASVW